VSGWNLVFLAVEAVVYFALVLVLEIFSARSCLAASPSSKLATAGLGQEEDVDVVAERRRIEVLRCRF
jgi:hypothetical protein